MGSDEGVEPAVEGVTFRGVDGGLSDIATEVAVLFEAKASLAFQTRHSVCGLNQHQGPATISKFTVRAQVQVQSVIHPLARL